MHRVTYSVADSFGTETELWKGSCKNARAINTPRYKTVNSDETSLLRSSYSINFPFAAGSPFLITAPLFNSKHSGTEVFERLVMDSNRRCESKVRLTELKKQQESALLRTYRENEEVYDRLFKDTEYRREKREVNEAVKAQKMNESLKTARSNKTCTKEEADEIVKRILCKYYLDSPKRTTENRYSRKREIDRINNKIKIDNAKKFGRNKVIAASCDKVQFGYMDIVERTEIEMMYGKPGKPANPDDNIKTAKKRARMKSNGSLSDVIKKKK